MPCFKGIAVSIHANGAPLPEHGMQKQSRFSRISTYIPVPQPQVDLSSNKPDPANFAKPKTLDPKTISTQTVTGIDGPDKPYASFTFFYRGERQLQKIGVLASSKVPQPTPGSAKRRSGQLDFSTLGPLKSTGTVGFSTFRDQKTDATRRRKARKKSIGQAGSALQDDSDDEDDDDSEVLGKMEDIEEKDLGSKMTPEDGQYSGELADGVNRIRLKRALSADPGSVATDNDTTNAGGDSAVQASIATQATSLTSEAAAILEPTLPSSVFGSPLKKQRPSIPGPGDQVPPLGLAASLLDGSVAQSTMPSQPSTKREEVEEDLKLPSHEAVVAQMIQAHGCGQIN
ncbi:hypothetical protein HYQ44_009701, partial [Verticillium longisporum]